MLRMRAPVRTGLALSVVMAIAAGCQSDQPLRPENSPDPSAPDFATTASKEPASPLDVAAIHFMGESFRCWPWTGGDFSGQPVDPLNLVFVGEARPLQIRAALLALDGDRSAFGLPDVYPFNATWSDAIGDLQTGWCEDDGWMGTLVQLQLGQYNPLRFHLRLIGSDQAFGEGGVWTMGAAHFELMIPGTADHQVLSWELAEMMVRLDMMRTGLLDPAVPMFPTGPINQAPGFRSIPGVIYNLLPPDLQALIGGPPGPVPGDVPIPSDGMGTILHLTGAAEVTMDRRSQTMTFTYNQDIPRPICSSGPYDFVHVAGDVTFEKTVSIDERGRFDYHSGYSGHLAITPLGLSASAPGPSGETMMAIVSEKQHGFLTDETSLASAFVRRLLPGAGGTQMVLVRLDVATPGPKAFSVQNQCP